MGFFQNLKEDLSTAMNELIADENAVKDEETKPLLPGEGPLFGDTEGEAKNSDADKKEDAEPELEEGEDFMEKILAQTEKELQKTEEKEADAPLDLEDALDKPIAEIVGADEELTETTDNEADDEPGEDSDTDELAEKILAASDIDEDELPETEEEDEEMLTEEESQEEDSEESEVENDDADIYEEKENRVMEETMIQTGEISEETATITEGMKITGNVDSNGHMDVLGTIVGNINIAGKLNVSGSVTGDSKANEIFADGAEITGEVCAVGSIRRWICKNCPLYREIIFVSTFIGKAFYLFKSKVLPFFGITFSLDEQALYGILHFVVAPRIRYVCFCRNQHSNLFD